MKNPDTKRRFLPPMVGGSSLLVIFAVLCLIVFTLLTLSTVQANRRLSEASIQAVTDYYEADRQAEMIFAQLRSGQLPPQVEKQRLSKDFPLPGTSIHTGDLYTYSCSISDSQILVVELHRDHGDWTVLRWQAVSTVTYQ